ncbi:hypothetical protein EVAR_33261_1 [Eumeta japonica]|uniref:Uncharacterized protein n=1 Tax=Eumeta variegata TaxID=151549 RepID=A0A4C1X0N0_EUMVA|nr:hypothetical protein EVAR_33261_1 [Eumeta japonica]
MPPLSFVRWCRRASWFKTCVGRAPWIIEQCDSSARRSRVCVVQPTNFVDSTAPDSIGIVVTSKFRQGEKDSHGTPSVDVIVKSYNNNNWIVLCSLNWIAAQKWAVGRGKIVAGGYGTFISRHLPAAEGQRSAGSRSPMRKSVRGPKRSTPPREPRLPSKLRCLRVYESKFTSAAGETLERGGATFEFLSLFDKIVNPALATASEPYSELSESSWSPPPMDARSRIEVTSALPGSWEGIGYLTERGSGRRGSGPPELSLTEQNTAAEVANSRPYPVRATSQADRDVYIAFMTTDVNSHQPTLDQHVVQGLEPEMKIEQGRKGLEWDGQFG